MKCQHLGAKSVYCCPSYAGEFRSNWSPRTYGMNSFLREPPDVAYPYSCAYLTGIRQSRIKAPSSTILLYEGMPANSGNPLGEGYVYRCGNWTCVGGYAVMVHFVNADKPWHRGFNIYPFISATIFRTYAGRLT